jgi:alanine-synthesizing transaminase
MQRPMGAMYAFLRLDERFNEVLDDQAFALDLLENHHVLVAPGSSFNTPYTDHFRITTLPDTGTLDVVFDRIEACLAQYN